MQFLSVIIFSAIYISNPLKTKADEDSYRDELTLRNQLFADVFLLKEGVDHLQTSVEVLNKRHNNEMEILKDLKFRLVDNDLENKDNVCHKITSMFNMTLRKYNMLENNIVSKLEQTLYEQTMRLDEMSLKQNLNKNCASPSSSTLSLMSNALAEVNAKLEAMEEKLLKLATVTTNFNLEKLMINDTLQEIHEKLYQNQQQVTQKMFQTEEHLKEINGKLTKNQEQNNQIYENLKNLKELANNFDKVMKTQQQKLPTQLKNMEELLQEINRKVIKNKEENDKIFENLKNLEEIKNKVAKAMRTHHQKLPMELILGLTSSNITKFN